MIVTKNTSDEEQKNEQKGESEEEKEDSGEVKETSFNVARVKIKYVFKAYHHKPLNNAQPLVGFQKTDIKIRLFLYKTIKQKYEKMLKTKQKIIKIRKIN